jgi:hypothetical protein
MKFPTGSRWRPCPLIYVNAHFGASKPTRLEEARRILEEYANDLREIIRELRQKLN